MVRPDPCFFGGFGGGRIIPGPDYTLGPGDVIDVQLVGRLEVTRHQLMVDAEGTVGIPLIGRVEVGEATLRDVHARISDRARALFRFADVTVSVVSPRCFEVVLSGEVERAGALQAAAVRRVHEIVLAAGGVTPRGSARRVKVTTPGSERDVDLLRFEFTGDLRENPYVSEGMKIHVPSRGPAVALTGAFRRPGEYEIGSSGSLAELLELVGGFLPSAARSKARLTRVGADGRKETFSVDLQTALARPADVQLSGSDAIFVPTLTVLQDVVEVRGAFNGTPESGKTTTGGKPTVVQRFELAEGERVRDLVTKAGGPAAFADLRLATVERRGPGGPAQRIPIDLHRLLVDKDDNQNIALVNGDVLSLPIAEDKVFVLGEVKSPGAQDFRSDLTPREYVALAGGPGNRARIKAITVTFRDGRSFPVAQSPPLEPGAVVTVPEVSVKWWQDYVAISNVVTGLIAAYTGIFILFGGRTGSVFGPSTQ